MMKYSILIGSLKGILVQNQNNGIRIPQLAKITTLSRDWWRSLNEQKVLLFDCIEREGNLKDTHRYTKDAAINVDLFQNIFWFPNNPFLSDSIYVIQNAWTSAETDSRNIATTELVIAVQNVADSPPVFTKVEAN